MNGFNIYRGINDLKFVVPKVDNPVSPEVRSKSDDVLDLVFSIDPRTGYPSGAIQQYLSEKTNQQVREYILNNVLVDLPDNSFSTPDLQARFVTREIGDDFMIQCMKRRDETVEDYELRVNNYLDSQKKIRDTERRMRELNSKDKANAES